MLGRYPSPMAKSSPGFWFGLLFAGAAAYLLRKTSDCPICHHTVVRGVRNCRNCGIGLRWPVPS